MFLSGYEVKAVTDDKQFAVLSSSRPFGKVNVVPVAEWRPKASKAAWAQIFLDVHPEIPAIPPATSSGVPLKLGGAQNAAFSSFPLSCWDHFTADSILVDTSDCQHHRPLPKKRHQLYEPTFPL